jgi:hypothetical protein
MTTQQARKKAIRRMIHKHLLEGDWLICFDTERDCFDAFFLDRDNRLVVYPMTDVRERVSNELLPYVKTAGDMLYFEAPDGRFVGLLPNYEKYLQPEKANRLRKRLDRIIPGECHKLVNDLMCLEFGVCNQEDMCGEGDTPRRIKSLRITTRSWRV